MDLDTEEILAMMGYSKIPEGLEKVYIRFKELKGKITNIPMNYDDIVASVMIYEMTKKTECNKSPVPKGK